MPGDITKYIATDVITKTTFECICGSLRPSSNGKARFGLGITIGNSRFRNRDLALRPFIVESIVNGKADKSWSVTLKKTDYVASIGMMTCVATLITNLELVELVAKYNKKKDADEKNNRRTRC